MSEDRPADLFSRLSSFFFRRWGLVLACVVTTLAAAAPLTKPGGITTWVEPKLVGEVKFTEWTSKGEMRHPVFMGLRTDKKAEEVIREEPKASAKPSH